MDLSDAWVVAVVESAKSREERNRRWPSMFKQKGLRSAYIHKGDISASEGLDRSNEFRRRKARNCIGCCLEDL